MTFGRDYSTGASRRRVPPMPTAICHQQGDCDRARISAVRGWRALVSAVMRTLEAGRRDRPRTKCASGTALLFLVSLVSHARPVRGTFEVTPNVIDVFRGTTNALLNCFVPRSGKARGRSWCDRKSNPNFDGCFLRGIRSSL